jgi:phosphatidylserine/phosphatidylglycerophosphate/cardiolipin synthase-like enzyme
MTSRQYLVFALLAACGTPGSSGTDAPPGHGIDAPGGPMVDAAPIVPTTAVSIIVEPNGQDGAELVAALKTATATIELTMYQLDDTDVINALVARQKAGATVRVILDGSTTCKSWNMPAYTTMKNAGVGVVWSDATFTFTHEKTAIIDDKVAWIMTMNSNTSSPGTNREYLAIDTDAGDIAEAKAIFNGDYAQAPITPSGNLVVADINARAALVQLIKTATTTLDVEGEEFSDLNTGGVVAAVVQAANRGVAVRVIVANDSSPLADQTTAISDVKHAGGKVVVTGPTSGNGTASNPYIHSKALLVDCSGTTCARGFIGSENFTAGSLGYNRELGVTFTVPAELAKIKTAIDKDFAAGTAQ